MRQKCTVHSHQRICRSKPKYLVYKNVTLASDEKFCSSIVLHKINTTRFLLPIDVSLSVINESGDEVNDEDSFE